MANSDGVHDHAVFKSKVVASVVAAAVPNQIVVIDVRGRETLFIDMTIGVEALDAIQFSARAHKDSGFDVVVATAAADFTTPNAPVNFASGDLNVAAIGSHFVSLDVRGMADVEVKAGSAAGTATVQIDHGLR